MNPPLLVETEQLDDFRNFRNQPRRLEYLALTMFVAVTVLVSANAVISRIGSLYVGGISTMLGR